MSLPQLLPDSESTMTAQCLGVVRAHPGGVTAVEVAEELHALGHFASINSVSSTLFRLWIAERVQRVQCLGHWTYTAQKETA